MSPGSWEDGPMIIMMMAAMELKMIGEGNEPCDRQGVTDEEQRKKLQVD